MDVVELLKKLVKIDTRNPPGYTGEAVEFLQNFFSSYECRVYEKNGKLSIVVEVSKGKPTLMLTSHLDTVPASDALLNPVIVDGKLYGRGSCDAKASVAAMSVAAIEADVECGLKLTFTADEEVGGAHGLGYVFEREGADAVIVGEPTGLDAVGVLQAAVVAVDLEFEGESGHTAMKDASLGAIYRAAVYILDAVKRFREMSGDYGSYAEELRKLGFEFTLKSWQAVFNPAMISGGVKRNVVAPSCVVKADVRFAPWIPISEVREALNCGCRVKVEGFLQPYGFGFDSVKKEDDVKLLRILGKVAGRYGKPKAVFSLGVGDTRHVRKHGVPAFYYGPSGGDIHGENEFVYLHELREFVEAYKKIVELFKTF